MLACRVCRAAGTILLVRRRCSVAAGVGGAVEIAALYAALAAGRMGIVSPITAVVGASVPIVVGFALHERPSGIALAGDPAGRRRS